MFREGWRPIGHSPEKSVQSLEETVEVTRGNITSLRVGNLFIREKQLRVQVSLETGIRGFPEPVTAIMICESDFSRKEYYYSTIFLVPRECVTVQEMEDALTSPDEYFDFRSRMSKVAYESIDDNLDISRFS
jgi:hypothetical protein